jgi:hypothetical protein
MPVTKPYAVGARRPQATAAFPKPDATPPNWRAPVRGAPATQQAPGGPASPPQSNGGWAPVQPDPAAPGGGVMVHDPYSFYGPVFVSAAPTTTASPP